MRRGSCCLGEESTRSMCSRKKAFIPVSWLRQVVLAVSWVPSQSQAGTQEREKAERTPVRHCGLQKGSHAWRQGTSSLELTAATKEVSRRKKLLLKQFLNKGFMKGLRWRLRAWHEVEKPGLCKALPVCKALPRTVFFFGPR